MTDQFPEGFSLEPQVPLDEERRKFALMLAVESTKDRDVTATQVIRRAQRYMTWVRDGRS